MDAIPKDTAGKVPAPARIFGSLPTQDYARLTVPGMREDVLRAKDAWQDGDLSGNDRRSRWAIALVVMALAVFLAWVVSRWSRRVR